LNLRVKVFGRSVLSRLSVGVTLLVALEVGGESDVHFGLYGRNLLFFYMVSQIPFCSCFQPW